MQHATLLPEVRPTGRDARGRSETRAQGLWRAPGHAERRSWLEWLHYAETIGQHMAQLTQQHIVLREDWMRSPTVMKLEAMRLARVLAAVGAAADRNGWLLPSGFSAVDVAIGYGVHTGFCGMPGVFRVRRRWDCYPRFDSVSIWGLSGIFRPGFLRI